jgi:hypothetical protein
MALIAALVWAIADRPYHPNYTHAVFRGWYEFGGGSIADMGHYSLWPIFQLLDLESPISVESTPSHVCAVSEDICLRIKNDYSFPAACTIRMRFASKGERPDLDIFWYDGGIKPPVPEELMAENKELPEEGMMFVGDKGKILGGFRGESPQLIPESNEHLSRAQPARPSRAAGWKWTADACAECRRVKATRRSGELRRLPLAGLISTMNLASISLVAVEAALGFREGGYEHP